MKDTREDDLFDKHLKSLYGRELSYPEYKKNLKYKFLTEKILTSTIILDTKEISKNIIESLKRCLE
jgi:hypothetical protein